MKNNIKVKATYNEKDKSWYLDITPPIYMNGSVIVQEGILYFPTPYYSKEEAYETGKSYLRYIGINEEIIDNKLDYE